MRCWWLALGDKPISTPGDGFNVSRLARGIAEHFAQAVDRCVQPVFEIAKGCAGPKSFLQFFARDHSSLAVQQKDENVYRLPGNFYSLTVLTQLSAIARNLKGTEADRSLHGTAFPSRTRMEKSVALLAEHFL